MDTELFDTFKEVLGKLESENEFDPGESINLYSALQILTSVLESKNKKEGGLSEDSLDKLAKLASELDSSDDESKQAQASVLDEILLGIGAKKKAVAGDDYKNPYQLGQSKYVDEAKKAIKDKVKEFRPLEAPLSTRTCPDHPGALLARTEDHVYQCQLDKAYYNYQAGFTTMKGNKVPGGSVQNQTRDFDNPVGENLSFNTRESRLNEV